MCACNQSKDSELADKLRYHHNERNRLLNELKERGFTVYHGKNSAGGVIAMFASTIEKIEKIEKISL